ncbi:MAG: Gfo/Idh/MocA family oxidoreductase [Lachnospiraceae bacterium]|nr:Gfo/Idh/MocA family oxidoreductase [Lachnospiraceae bacterium]
MDKVRIGLFGCGRGSFVKKYCQKVQNAELVAVCDKVFETQDIPDNGIAHYTKFEDFIKHDMDAVVLANYANEHAPFAIKAMKAGKHVLSEVLPCQCMKEAVELVETAEATGMIYAYSENYCYMPAPREMKRLYLAGELGEFEYGEGEYIHNCEPLWCSIQDGPDHWRNNMYANFYCTHSIGPLIHITGLRPIKVTGFELPCNSRTLRMGRKAGAVGIEMITLENGAMLKSIHGDLGKDSVWYTIYGSKGRMESEREDVREGEHAVCTFRKNIDQFEGECADHIETYRPTDALTELASGHGHGSSDFYVMYNFIEKILGNPEADTIDVYEAMDMFLPGLFAYRSVLEGGKSMDIPNLRFAADRERYRYDTACVDPKVAGNQLLPSYSKGSIEIPDEVYQNMYTPEAKMRIERYLTREKNKR